MTYLPVALTIAGTDPSGGAGIMADLKSFQARDVYGMAVVTSLVAQNTRGVQLIEHVSPQMLKAQLDESNLTKTGDEELAQSLGEQFIKKNQIDISCQEGESAQECQTRILERAGFSQFQKELDEFNNQYEKCEDSIAMDRRIDLQNHSLVFRYKIRCMIVNNQGEMLDKIAESDDNLAQTIYEVKKGIFPSHK